MVCSFEASGPCRGLVPGARGQEAPQQRVAIEAGEETETGKGRSIFGFLGPELNGKRLEQKEHVEIPCPER